MLYRTRSLRTFLTPRYFLGLRTDQFVCPIYSTPFDVSYVPYEIIRSVGQKRPNSSNSITFDPDRNLRFWVDHWRGNFHVHSFLSFTTVSLNSSVQCRSNISDLGGTQVQQSFRSRRNTYAAVCCFCAFPPHIMCRIFLYIQKRFNIPNSLINTTRASSPQI